MKQPTATEQEQRESAFHHAARTLRELRPQSATRNTTNLPKVTAAPIRSWAAVRRQFLPRNPLQRRQVAQTCRGGDHRGLSTGARGESRPAWRRHNGCTDDDW